MIEILFVLGFPLAGAALLAALGHRRIAPTVNVAVSFCTFLAAAVLTARVVTDGPMLVLDRQFFVDPFNVFLVALTAFVGFTTAIFSRPYMRIEEEHKRVSPARARSPCASSRRDRCWRSPTSSSSTRSTSSS